MVKSRTGKEYYTLHIPKAVVEMLGLSKGDLVAFEPTEDGVLIKKAKGLI